MTQVAIAETNGRAVALPGSVDPYEAYANIVAPRNIIGEMLKFAKGDFIAGDDEIVAPGTTFTANCDELLAGWIKWQSSKPVEQIMVRVGDGVPPLKRHELGDTDPSLWEKDDKGEPKDPWQFTNYLPMMDANGVLYTFTTSSRGGIGAIGELSRRYSKHRKRNPDVHPLIALDVGSYKHANKAYGIIKFPEFVPAGYEDKGKFAAAMVTAGYDADVGAVAPTAADTGDAMNDEIPF
jgi:hypothetical protein